MTFLILGGAFAQSPTGNPIASASISPNPVEDRAELNFDEPLGERVTVVIKDLTGKTVLSITPEMNGHDCTSIPLELDAFRKGIYICQITGTSGKVKTLKFQKT